MAKLREQNQLSDIRKKFSATYNPGGANYEGGWSIFIRSGRARCTPVYKPDFRSPFAARDLGNAGWWALQLATYSPELRYVHGH